LGDAQMKRKPFCVAGDGMRPTAQSRSSNL
jgi:hypothetical protein